jgi:hypothetical protein
MPTKFSAPDPGCGFGQHSSHASKTSISEALSRHDRRDHLGGLAGLGSLPNNGSMCVCTSNWSGGHGRIR